MSRAAFFVWQRGLKHPTSAVYFETIPTRDGRKIKTIATHIIPGGTGNTEFFPGPGEMPSMAALEAAYPLPTQGEDR